MIVCPECHQLVLRMSFLVHYLWAHVGPRVAERLCRFAPDEHMVRITDGGDVCPICWNELSQDTAVQLRRCRHAFCHGCINTWWQQHSNCPVCMHDYDVR